MTSCNADPPSSGKTVTELEYEAYPSMALKTMQAIVNEARQLSSNGSFSFAWPSYPNIPSSHHPASSTIPPPSTDLTPQVHSQSSLITELTKISLVHRLGIVPPKESSISIVVSSPHRREAFRACEWILEEVKKRVEVWKREVYAPSSTASDAEDKQVEKVWKENFPKN
jgi:molybdopterin synthase catalytic subunit